MKYAHYNETDGKLIGWYDSEIHTALPTPNIEVSEEDWQIAVDNNYNYVDVTNSTLSKKDFRTFEELQQAKVGEVKQAYSNELTLGYTCSNGIKMDAEQDKVNLLKNGYDLSVKVGNTTMDIRDYDNVVHSAIAVDDVDYMITELGLNISTQLARKWALEEQVNNATTQADLDDIIW